MDKTKGLTIRSSVTTTEDNCLAVYSLGKVSSAILILKEVNELNCSQPNKLLLQDPILAFSSS